MRFVCLEDDRRVDILGALADQGDEPEVQGVFYALANVLNVRALFWLLHAAVAPSTLVPLVLMGASRSALRAR